MQQNVSDTPRAPQPGDAGIEPLRTDRTMSTDDADVAPNASSDTADTTVIGPDKARSATTNRMPARVLIISITLTAVTFLIGYLLVR